ncbi:MAG: SDR family oxidoreductase [Acidimicrobiales bacterium]|nr:SDR family oxidoreductase [Acidimicrobiales bacterium]
MELRLEHKVALVTGGSKGIGRAIAACFAGAGARVMIASRRAENLEAAAEAIEPEAAKGGGAISWSVAHAGRPEDAQRCVAATLERFGGLDILVNNAGTNPYYGPLMGIDQARAEKTTEVNQEGLIAWTQAAWKAAMESHGGNVINMASVGGLGVSPGIGYYNATKAAVVQLTRQLAFELAPAVRVNALAPGLVKTDFARALWQRDEAGVAAALPLQRLGEPEDVARAALFLASDAASWITGHVLVVDGGAMVARGVV